MLSETLQKLGFSSLNPLQRKAIEEGFIESPRVLVTAPTASGKTLLALLAISKHFETSNQPVFYVVPLRALASEKHREFVQALSSFELKAGISTGDFDSSSEELREYDVVVVTSEKLDSLLRHDASWLERIGLVVFDEAHLIGDGSRGATLEVVLTKLKRSNAKIVVLSATIPNNKDFSQWLSAKLIESDYRPTPLELGLFDGERLYLESEPPLEVKNVAKLVEEALQTKKRKGQALVFVSTRRSAEALARELCKVAERFLTEEEKQACALLSIKALKALPHSTAQCRLLAECLSNGVSFHHAGIENHQRTLIEDGFKQQRCLKAIVATTTLSMGLDLPASWVIVRDLKRYNGVFSDYLTKMECAQMVGRSGRPKFDDKGVGVLVCTPSELRKVRDKYIFGDLEDVYSQLSSEPSLRFHSLAIVASGYAKSFEELFGFFQSTFYAHQYGDATALLSTVERMVMELQRMDFVREKNSRLFATPLGKRVSELYVDPLSAHSFIEGMKKPLNDFSFLTLLQQASESRPLISVKRSEEQKLWEEWCALNEEEEDEQSVERFKTAKMLNAWVNEATEDAILNEFDVPPGVLHSRTRIQEWLAYAFSELAFLLNHASANLVAKKMRARIQHGVKEELLSLVAFRGIGRVRARRLWNAGVRTKEQFKTLTKEEIKRILRIREEI